MQPKSFKTLDTALFLPTSTLKRPDNKNVGSILACIILHRPLSDK